MKADHILNSVMGARILLDYNGFETQREETVTQLLDLAEALMEESEDVEKIMNEMASTHTCLLQMQMHYEEQTDLPLDARISALFETMAVEQEITFEDTI